MAVLGKDSYLVIATLLLSCQVCSVQQLGPCAGGARGSNVDLRLLV